MSKIIERLFGNEENATELQKFSQDLEIAINDIKKLEDDWKEKVRLVKDFVSKWDSVLNLEGLKSNIRIIVEIENKEKGTFDEELKYVLKLKIIIKNITETT